MEPSVYEEFKTLEDQHWWFRGRKAIFGHLLRALSRREGRFGTALDLGAGMGGMLDDLRAVSDRVLATDIDAGSLAHCRARGFPLAFLAHGGALPLGSASLDLITAFDTIEHIKDDAATLADCRRVLKPGGFMMISVPAWQFLYAHQDRVVHHERRYTKGLLRQRLIAAGLEPIQLSYFNALLFPAILPAVLLIKLKEFLRPPAADDRTTNVSRPLPKLINESLYRLMASERHALARMSLPLGHSLLAIARRPLGETSDHAR